MEKFRKPIGVICATIMIGAMIYAMFTIKAALIGISLGALLVSLVLGAAWGLSKNK